MKYVDFSAGDFIKDEYFQSWVFNRGDENTIIFWEGFLANHPEMRGPIEEARLALTSIQFSNYTISEAESTDLWNKIHDLEPVRDSGTNRMERFMAAASVVLIVTISVFYFWKDDRAWKEYHTAYGETKSVVLPDGSSVVLNANSKLTIASDWNQVDSEREIWLDGEAFFSVIHKKDNKVFRVKTKEGVSVEVLGTTFNVYNRITGT